MEAILPVLFALGFFLLRALWSLRAEGEERWKRYRKGLAPAFALYALLNLWGLGSWALLLLFLEVPLALGSYLHAEGYKALFAPRRDWEALAASLKPLLGEPERLQGEEQSPFLGLTVRFWAFRWCHRTPEGLEIWVWAFPHGSLKESGGKWWIPSLPRGASSLLRRVGRERDILLFPFAAFHREGFVYSGRQYVGVGARAVADLPAYLHLEGQIRRREELANRHKEALLGQLLRLLPGWRGWTEVPVEAHGEADLYLVAPSGRGYVVLLAKEKEGREALEQAQRIHRLLAFPVVVWRVAEEGGNPHPVAPGVRAYEGPPEGLAATLAGEGGMAQNL